MTDNPNSGPPHPEDPSEEGFTPGNPSEEEGLSFEDFADPIHDNGGEDSGTIPLAGASADDSGPLNAEEFDGEDVTPEAPTPQQPGDSSVLAYLLGGSLQQPSNDDSSNVPLMPGNEALDVPDPESDIFGHYDPESPEAGGSSAVPLLPTGDSNSGVNLTSFDGDEFADDIADAEPGTGGTDFADDYDPAGGRSGAVSDDDEFELSVGTDEEDSLVLDQSLGEIEREMSGLDDEPDIYEMAQEGQVDHFDGMDAIPPSESSSVVLGDVDEDYDDRPVAPESAVLATPEELDGSWDPSDATSEQEIVPTVGVDREGKPISAVDMVRPEAAPRAKRGGGAGQIALVGLMGLLIGASVFGGVWYAGLLPGSGPSEPKQADTQPLAAAPKTPKSDDPGPKSPAGKGDKQPAGPQMTPEKLIAEVKRTLRAGEPGRVLGMFKKYDGQVTPAMELARGQALWEYVVRRGYDDPARGPSDASGEVKRAKQLLKKLVEDGVNSRDGRVKRMAAEAQLWRGVISQGLNRPGEARKLYRQGLNAFPQSAAIFRAALHRLDLAAGDGPDGLGWASPEALTGLAVLLIGQAPERPNSGGPSEPGFLFWQAMVDARGKNYDLAINKLRAAAKLHRRAYDRNPARGVNRLSDPRGEIFPQVCRTLVRYFELRKTMYDDPAGRALVNAQGPEKAIRELLKKRGGAGMSEDAQKRLAAMRGQLATAENNLKEARADADGLRKAAEDAKQARTRAEAARKRAEAVLAAAAAKLKEAEYLPAGADAAQLTAGLDRVLAKANRPAPPVTPGQDVPPERLMAGAAADLAAGVAVRVRIARAEARAATEAKKAQTKIDTLRAQLEAQKQSAEKAVMAAKATMRKETDAALKRMQAQFATKEKTLRDELATAKERTEAAQKAAAAADARAAVLAGAATPAGVEKALTGAAQVLASENATPAEKAKAAAVKAMSLKAKGDFAGARAALAGVDLSGGEAWAAAARRAKSELTDAGPLLARIDRAEGREAGRLIDEGLRVFAGEGAAAQRGRLLARKAELLLDAGSVAAGKAAAAEAARLGAGGPAKLAAGRAAEAADDYAAAEAQYRGVLNDPAADADLKREARIRLSRVLIRSARSGGADVSRLPVRQRLALVTLLLQPPAGGSPAEEALALAEQAIADRDARGYIRKAEALAALGKPRDALKAFAEGLRRGAEVAPEDAAALTRLADGLPAPGAAGRPAGRPRVPLAGPAAVPVIDPREADVIFGQGVGHYYAGNYPTAERDLARAVALNGRDARYRYFLGLTRLALGRADLATADFAKGAELEFAGLPPRVEVDQSLFRVQGPVRAKLNALRGTLKAELEAKALRELAARRAAAR